MRNDSVLTMPQRTVKRRSPNPYNIKLKRTLIKTQVNEIQKPSITDLFLTLSFPRIKVVSEMGDIEM